MLKEVSYKDLKFNPFRLIGDEWMLVTAGNEKDGCNTMTAFRRRKHCHIAKSYGRHFSITWRQ